MVGLFGTLGTSTKGMGVNQIAMQTTSHNIANTNTDGYSRQRVNMKTDTPYYLAGVGTIGMGVKAGSVERIVDDFIVGQVREANSKYQYFAQKSDTLGQLESIFNEPSSSGLMKQLSNFFESWTNLSNNPELSTSKTLVIEKSSSLANTVGQMADQINKLHDDTLSTIENSALVFNEKVKQLEALNKQIYSMTTDGYVPNDLLDTRDNLLKDLSGFGNIKTTIDQHGRAFVEMDGQTVLNATERNTLSVVVGQNKDGAVVSKDGNRLSDKETIAGDYPVGTILLTKSGESETTYEPLTIKEGAIGGLQDSLGEIDDRLAELNDFVETVAKTINYIVTDGKSTTSGFFEIGDDPSKYAENFKVAAELIKNPSLLEAGIGGADGDGSKAAAIAKLATTKFDYPVTDETFASYDKETMSFKNSDTGMTYSGFFNSIVTKNGISKQQAEMTATSQLTLLNQVEYKNESISGVAINEEMSDVIRFQQGFQANARLITVISEMLDTLINRTGV